MNGELVRHCRASLEEHSKSFALAGRFLPRESSDRAAVVYAWCRRADDAVDRAAPGEADAAVDRLFDELAAIYAGAPQTVPECAAFQEAVRLTGIPRSYPGELLEGMAMDTRATSYATMDALLQYCFRVAGTVGLMMCHVMGLRDAGALRRAAHLGIAMQLTNICRDVVEDWNLGRLYLPADRLAMHGAPRLAERLGGPFPVDSKDAVAATVRDLLVDADRYYRSGDAGLDALSWRCSFAIRSAREIYAAIGTILQRRGCDVTKGRAIVPLRRKLVLAAGAGARSLADLPRRAVGRFEPAVLDPERGGQLVRFPEDVLPI